MLQKFDFSRLMNEFITPDRISLVIRVALILVIGIPLVKLIRKLTRKLVENKLSPQSEVLIVRMVYYASSLILIVTVLHEFGFKLSALLGAAGVLGVAIGFASQTSISNIISGIFLISEKPFEIGDFIKVGNCEGTIHSIDLLSIKLNTPDNRFIRVPNETMIKSEVINYHRYPVRRVNLEFPVSFETDLEPFLALLRDVADQATLSLKDKKPFISITGFGDSGYSILFGVWCNSTDFFALRDELIILLKESFTKNNIEIPFSTISVLND
jgi:small conductance mechanosensitive channel